MMLSLALTALWAALGASAGAAVPSSDENLNSIFDGRPLPGSDLKGAFQAFTKDSDWVPVVPQGTVSDGNISSPEKIDFWNRLQEKSFDQLCRAIEIPIDQGVGLAGVGEVKGGIKRYTRFMPDGRLALIDETKATVSLSRSQQLASYGGGSLALGISARLEGTSLTLRPLPSVKSCDALKKLVDLRTIKTMLPLRASRIQEMAVGELWKLPVTLNVSAGISVGGVFKTIPISVSVGAGREGRATMSLFRISTDTVRLRIRLDQAKFYSESGSLVATLPAAQLGLEGGANILTRFLDNELARALNRSLGITFTLSEGHRGGVDSALEFLADPKDPAQTEALARVLNGEMGVVSELKRMTTELAQKPPETKDAVTRLDAWESQIEDWLEHPANFSGLDQYERRGRSFHIKLPFFFDYESSSARNKDRLSVADDKGGLYTVVMAQKNKRNGEIDIPFLGQVTKHESQRTVQVVTYRDAAGQARSPAAIYVLQEGFLRHGQSSARSMELKSDAIMRLAGAQVAGANPRLGLPAESLVPEPPPPDPSQTPFGDNAGSVGPTEDIYRRGMTSLTVAFSGKAVEAAMQASAESALRAFANTLTGGPRFILQQAAQRQALSAKYAPVSDDEILQAEGLDRQLQPELCDAALNEARWVWRQAKDLMKDLDKARQAETPEARAEAFRDLLSGQGKSGLAYDDMVKVLIQLMDPLDISAEFYVQIDKHVKGEKDLQARYVLKRPVNDTLLESVMKVRNRFIEPSPYVD